jgi:hypothetical protein
MGHELTDFLTNLFYNGEVILKGSLFEFYETDKLAASALLKEMHKRALLQISFPPPDFNSEAAVWGAITTYKLLQFIMIRNLETEDIEKNFPAYAGLKNPESHFSADLCLRQLPEIYNLAKGLSPEDPLVLKIKEIAGEWPYSSVGIELNSLSGIETIKKNKSLFIAYIDRIIEKKDKHRMTDPYTLAAIDNALGGHSQILWPNYELLKQKNTDANN